MIRVLIADDNAVIRQGLASLLALADDIEVVGQAVNGRDALALAESCRPDVVLLDVRMPVVDGVAAAATLSENARVLMLTNTDDAEVVTAALRAGASGYLVYGSFEPEELARAVRGTADGQTHLSPAAASAVREAVRRPPPTSPGATTDGLGLSEREVEVMELIAAGRSNGEIAEALFLSEKTVKNHVNRIYAKLGVRHRGEAMARWLERGSR